MPAKQHPIAVDHGEAETVRSAIGGEVTFLARGEQNGGAFVALEVSVPPGEGPPLHVHTREDEWIYVVEGDFRWRLEEEMKPTGTGSFVFFDGLAHLTEFDLDEFRRVAAEYGMEVVGPPLAESDPLPTGRG